MTFKNLISDINDIHNTAGKRVIVNKFEDDKSDGV